MPTNKPVLRTSDQFMSDYTPVYESIYTIFLAGKSQQYPTEVGELNYRRIDTIGDVRAKHITPKDTEIRQVTVMEGKKTFKRYFLGNQFQISGLQAQEGNDEVVARVLDEHHVQYDEMFLTGEGTQASDVVNNGLFWSNDSNYTLESSVAIAASGRLSDFYSKVATTAAKANTLSGQKVLMFYGSDVKTLYNSLFPNSDSPVKRVMADALGPTYRIVELPDSPVPSGANGWIVANLEQAKFHYTTVPVLRRNGFNEEHDYYWYNFLMGSNMLEVLAKNGVIRQPSTLA